MYAPIRRFLPPIEISDLHPEWRMILCPGQGTAMMITTSGGVPPYTYQWYCNDIMLTDQHSNDDFYPTPSDFTSYGSTWYRDPQTSEYIGYGATNVYKVVVTDSVGQTADYEFVVNNVEKLTIDGSSVAGERDPLYIFNDRPYTFEPVVSGGKQPYTFRWLRNAAPTNVTTSTYTFDPTLYNYGNVQPIIIFTVYDICGSALTAIYRLNLVDPIIISDIAPRTICQNGTVNFYPTVTGGNPPYNYKWYKNNVEILDSNHATYTTQSADATPGATNVYKLEVTDQSSNVASNEFYIYVHNALTASDITGGNINVAIGVTHELSVSVTSGNGSYTYRWESSYNGSNWFVADGTYNQSIYQADISDTGITYYRVKITDGCGSSVTKGPVTINVVDPLTVTDDPQWITQTICLGGTRNFWPTVTGGVAPYTYQWYKDNVAIQGETDEDYTTPQSDTMTYGAHIVYKVVVTDSVGLQAYLEYTVNVYDEIVIDTIPTQNVVVGDTLTITPTVSGGRPNLTYSWYNLNTSFSPIAGETSSSYTIPATDTATAGSITYKVRVTDACLLYTEQQFTVNVIPTLTVSQLFTEETKDAGVTVNMRPIISGGTSPYTRQFYKDNDLSTVIYNGIGYTTPQSDAIAGETHVYTCVITDTNANASNPNAPDTTQTVTATWTVHWI